MKKFLALMLALVMAGGIFSGCSGAAAPAEKPKEEASIKKDEAPKTEAPTEKKTEEKKEESKEEKKELQKLKVAYNPGTGNILGFIAIEKGIAAEEGIEIELVPFSNSTDALTALQAGKIDIAVSFGTAAPLTFVTKGADFSIFGGYLSGGMPVYAASNLEYTGLESYVGKTVATPRMYTPDIVWRGAMLEAGYDLEKDVNIIEFKKPTEVLEAVKSGKADIGIGTNSTYLQALAADLQIIGWSNDFWDPVHVCCRPVANNAWIEANKDAVKGFLRSYIRAEKILQDDPEYGVELNMKYLEVNEEDARTMLLETNQIFETDPKSKGVKYMWDTLINMDYIEPGDIDVDDHINIELYKEALDELTQKEPESEFYKKLQEKFIEYNE